MPSDVLQVKVDGFEQLVDYLGEFAERLVHPFKNLSTALKVRTAYVTEVERQVKKGQSGGWPPLTPTYRASKARRYPGRPLLVRTGAMMAGVLDSGGSAVGHHPDFEFKISDKGKRLTMGSTNPIAAYHQKGGGSLPARPLFVMTKKLSEEMAQIITTEALPTLTRRRGGSVFR